MISIFREGLPKPHPVIVKLSTGQELAVDLLSSGRHITVTPAPHANSRRAQQDFIHKLEALAKEGGTDWSATFDFYRDKHDTAAAKVGWLRDAYLVAFACFGYRYILHPALAAVREQLASPTIPKLPLFKIIISPGGPESPAFGIIRAPDWLRSVFMRFGRHTVFLPHPDDPDIYARLQAHRAASPAQMAPVTIDDGVVAPLPTGPIHSWDFDLANPIYFVRS